MSTDLDVAAIDKRLAVTETVVDALEKAVNEKFVALRERTAAALEALRLSSEELGKSQEKRLDVLNEFRGSVNKIIDTLVTMIQLLALLDALRVKIIGEVNVLRAEHQGSNSKMQSEIDELKLGRAKIDGAASQFALNETQKAVASGRAIALAGLISGLLALILTAIKFFQG